MQKTFKSTYVEKNGLFSHNKYDISLSLSDEAIRGDALKLSNTSGYSYQPVNYEYGLLSNYKECNYKGYKALQLDFETKINSNIWIDTYIFPLEEQQDISEIIQNIEEYKERYNIEQSKKKQLEEEQRQRQIEIDNKKREKILSIQNFYDNVRNFHIKEDTPVYTVSEYRTNCFVIYISKDKGINFLVIDAEAETEIHTVITYNEIHYYEKAGEVHYATSINANYKGSQSFGGSFVGAEMSTGSVALGGLLLGQMGMAIGALSSYKPATYTPPRYTPSQLNISSEITKIDERSVILNYYSEQHKQYIDIELPQDIYNFLQTHIPEKKYAIVIEKEKQSAISKTTAATEDTTIQRLQKLKQLYEMELISESEYAERKREILAEI